MSTNEMRKQAGQRIRSLSPERLRVALDFIAYLEERECNEATNELLNIPGFLEEFQKNAGKSRKLKSTPWRKVRSDV